MRVLQVPDTQVAALMVTRFLGKSSAASLGKAGGMVGMGQV